MIRLTGLLTAFVILAGAHLSPAAAEDKTLTIFAAASMKNALDEIDAAYTAKTGIKFSVSYAASSVLAKQIEQGAPADVFVSVTLPLALPGVLAGMVLGFAKAIGEFGATITFVSNIPGETQTISSAIYSLIQTPDGDAAAARLVAISIALAIGALIAAEWFARRATQRLHGN